MKFFSGFKFGKKGVAVGGMFEKQLCSSLFNIKCVIQVPKGAKKEQSLLEE